MPGLIEKSEFMGLEFVTHLASGGESPALLSHAAAMTRFMVDKSSGVPARGKMYATASSARTRIARLLNAKPAEIALLWNATAGLHAVLQGMDWREGDNVVVAGAGFPSLLHIWQANHVELRRVGAGPVPTLDEVSAAVNEQTRVIVVSHVSYLTGARVDIAALRAIADRHGSRLILDASHSLGVVPVDGRLCDAVVSACYKWLLGTHGVGIFYANTEKWPELEPRAVGWNSVIGEPDWRQRETYRLKPTMEKFEGGNPSFLPIYYLDNALTRLAEVGIERIEAHVLDLGHVLWKGLRTLGAELLTPESAEQRAGNISIAHPGSEKLEEALRQRGVLTWGGDNRLRISVHLFNDEADIDRCLAELAAIRDQI